MICFSFDTDHLDEGRMEEFLAQVPVPGRATFFCTQRYECLARSDHELGPHAYLPSSGGDWDTELREKRDLFPQAVGWRSHSCVFSHLIAEDVAKLGYRYMSTFEELGRPQPQPFRQTWGNWHLPVYYMDNLDFSGPRFYPDAPAPFSRELITRSLAGDGIYVYAFHPIHLLLNSPNAETYFELRERWHRGEPVESLRFDGYGTRSFYDELIGAMGRAGFRSAALADGLEAHLARTAGPAAPQ